MSVYKLMVDTFIGFSHTEFGQILDNLQWKSHYFLFKLSLKCSALPCRRIFILFSITAFNDHASPAWLWNWSSFFTAAAPRRRCISFTAAAAAAARNGAVILAVMLTVGGKVKLRRTHHKNVGRFSSCACLARNIECPVRGFYSQRRMAEHTQMNTFLLIALHMSWILHPSFFSQVHIVNTHVFRTGATFFLHF